MVAMETIILYTCHGLMDNVEVNIKVQDFYRQKCGVYRANFLFNYNYMPGCTLTRL